MNENVINQNETDIYVRYTGGIRALLSYFVSTHCAPALLSRALGQWRAAGQGPATGPSLWLWDQKENVMQSE